MVIPNNTCVLSLVYSPPGTKLYATTHTDPSVRTMYTTLAKVSVRATGRQNSLSIIAGQTDMV